MTISDINAGFDLDYGVTVNSHSSNARLNTCGSITQIEIVEIYLN